MAENYTEPLWRAGARFSATPPGMGVGHREWAYPAPSQPGPAGALLAPAPLPWTNCNCRMSTIGGHLPKYYEL